MNLMRTFVMFCITAFIIAFTSPAADAGQCPLVGSKKATKLTNKMTKEWIKITRGENGIFALEGTATDPDLETNSQLGEAVDVITTAIFKHSDIYIGILEKLGVPSSVISDITQYNADFINTALQYSEDLNVQNGNDTTDFNTLYYVDAPNLADAFASIDSDFANNTLFLSQLQSLAILITQVSQSYRFADTLSESTSFYYNGMQSVAEDIAVNLINAAISACPANTEGDG